MNSQKNKGPTSPSSRRNAITSFPSCSKQTSWHLPLRGKSFFLHVSGYKKTAELETKIKYLGGVVEKFLSRDVTCVITNQTNRERKSPRKRTQDNRPRIQTRAQAMVAQARSSNDNDRGTVIAKARTWGLQVKQLAQAVRWIEAQLTKRPAADNSDPSPLATTGRVRKLKGEFLKVEDQSRQFRPLVKEMSSWPRPNLTASPGSSPFDGPVATRTRARLSSGSPQSPAAVDQRQLSKNANTNATAKTTKRGYCEACGVMYASLSEHLRGSQHKAFAARKGNFDDLDRLIARGKSLAEYVAEVRGSTAFNTTGACGLESSRLEAGSRKRKAQAKRTSDESQSSQEGSEKVLSTSKASQSSSKSNRKGKTRSSRKTAQRTCSSPLTAVGQSSKMKRTRSYRKASTKNIRTSSAPSKDSRGWSSQASTASSTSSSRSSRTVTPVRLVRRTGGRFSVLRLTGTKRQRNATKVKASPSRRTKKQNAAKTYKVVQASATRIKLRRRSKQH